MAANIFMHCIDSSNPYKINVLQFVRDKLTRVNQLAGHVYK